MSAAHLAHRRGVLRLLPTLTRHSVCTRTAPDILSPITLFGRHAVAARSRGGSAGRYATEWILGDTFVV
jgi:hypothetical protein